MKRRGCNKGSFLVPAKPIHILCVFGFRYCPFVIENLALTGLRFGTFGAIKVGWVIAYKPGMIPGPESTPKCNPSFCFKVEQKRRKVFSADAHM